MENLKFRKDLPNYIKTFVPRDKDMKSPSVEQVRFLVELYNIFLEFERDWKDYCLCKPIKEHSFGDFVFEGIDRMVFGNDR